MTIATDAIIKPFEITLPKVGTTPGQPWYLQTSFLTEHRNRIITALQYTMKKTNTHSKTNRQSENYRIK